MKPSQPDNEPNRSANQSSSGEPNSAPDADLVDVFEQELGELKTQAIAVAKFASATAKLAIQEAGYALTGLPKLVLLAVTAWQLSLVMWFTLVGLSGWLAYSATESVTIGIIASITLQVIGIGICVALISSYAKRFDLRRTKAVVRRAQETYNDQR
ncbi:MAG TPA: hypothetical protein VIC26_08560 [Marinagarivorans sp.]